MSCGRRITGETEWRCWRSDCVTCSKKYRLIASRNVDDLLEKHEDMRYVWWLPVSKMYAADLSYHARRLSKALWKRDRMPEKYVWWVTESCEAAARYMIADGTIPDRDLAHYWQDRYVECLPADIVREDRTTIRRTTAAHCGMHDLGDAVQARTGGANAMPGISPRRYSKGTATPPSNEIVYRQWTDLEGSA